MRRIQFISLLFLVFASISFVSCDNEPIDSAIDLDDFGGDGNGGNNQGNSVFKATIEGEVFTSNNLIASYSDTSFGPQLAITAINSVGESISIQCINPSVGTFSANTTASTLLLFQYNSTITGGSAYSSLNSSNNTSVGSLTITSFNTTTNKISGTFSFTGFNATNSSLQTQITLGEFTNISFSNTTTNNTSVNGTYKLTAFNTSIPTDLNGDGTSVTNQLNETTCLNDMFLTLNANNTFTADSKGVEITINNVIGCFTDPDITGTWSVTGNVLTLTYVDAGDTYNDSYTINGNTLSLTVQDGTVVGTAGGNPVELTCDITIVYTKQ
ncbi:lipocalin family protein [Flavobacterium sp.]|uniref:lipocalin family protein n=1 Tax=Flavobacterium sp. TaxID=239 RepID=UPI002B4B4990|nr:lipocalin family protein [Flavobacterium sp.]HLP65296.1 lipocalin family protein [Flavobacterium sp.]